MHERAIRALCYFETVVHNFLSFPLALAAPSISHDPAYLRGFLESERSVVARKHAEKTEGLQKLHQKISEPVFVKQGVVRVAARDFSRG